jgi:tetratricopeptide (TPR) repeat protein
MPIVLLLIALFCLSLSGCLTSGVTVNKGETMGYLADTYRKSKQWFRSTDGSAVDGENGPPPPMATQPTRHQSSKAISSNPTYARQPVAKPSPKKSIRMEKKDYAKAINRLKKSIPELEKKWGKNHMEVGETHYTIAAMYDLRGDKIEAREYYQNALIIFSARLGNKHPRVSSIQKKITALSNTDSKETVNP